MDNSSITQLGDAPPRGEQMKVARILRVLFASTLTETRLITFSIGGALS